MFNYKQLLAFATIVEEGSFSKAAKKLFITQPAISAQIKSMEKELEVTLIERGERGVILTKAGEMLYANSRVILNQYKVLEDALTQYKSTTMGSLRIGASTIPGEYLIPKYIQKYKKKNPKIRIFVDICDSKCVLDKVMNGEVAIGIIGFQPKESDIHALPFVKDALKLICAPNLTFDDQTPLSQLLKAPHIFREMGSGTRAAIEKHFLKSGIQIERDLDYTVLGSTKATLTAVEQGLGLAWLSEHALEDALKLGKIKCLNTAFDIPRHFYLITQKNRTLSPLEDQFLKHLSQSATRNDQ